MPRRCRSSACSSRSRIAVARFMRSPRQPSRRCWRSGLRRIWVGLLRRTVLGEVLAHCSSGCYACKVCYHCSNRPPRRYHRTSGMTRFANARQRRALLAIQDFRCALCNREIVGRFECDHVVPFTLGGRTTTSELQALCIPCHQLKSLRDGSHPQCSSSVTGNKELLTC
jgi:hypothetical protein